MNAQQFIQKWCQPGAEDNMQEDLKMVIKDAFEEKEAFKFKEVPYNSSDFKK